MSRRRRVALLIETSNTYARELLHGIRAWMREHEAWIIRLSEQRRGEAVPAWLKDWDGDGIIARVENRRISNSLARTGKPVVDVSAALSTTRFPRIVTDSHSAMRLAADHLIERGFGRFGYCGDPKFLWSVQRGRAFASYLKLGGFRCSVFDPSRHPNDTDDDVSKIAAWLKSLELPAAVVACYDVRGQEVLEACKVAGIHVPDELGVVGVHNDDLLCDLCDPPLTSVIPNARRAGYEAADTLSRIMAGESIPAEIRFIEPVGIAPRQSTDVLQVPDARLAEAVWFIRDNVDRNIGVADVLRAVPMSRTLLERRFKQHLGCTPHEYLTRERIARAKTLLTQTDLPIGTIANRLGFSYVEYLSVAFRRETGMSPRAFRARYRVTQDTL